MFALSKRIIDRIEHMLQYYVIHIEHIVQHYVIQDIR